MKETPSVYIFKILCDFDEVLVGLGSLNPTITFYFTYESVFACSYICKSPFTVKYFQRLCQPKAKIFASKLLVLGYDFEYPEN